MRKIRTEILVIGGGATGAGVARDLAMRGFQTILVERGDLTQGTTGRYHGLLHSGGRYVVRDPLAARECIEENRILRRILPECIEDTGGFFVLTPWDDESYVQQFVQGCQTAGIPCEEISIAQMLREEPLLNPNILRCFRVPDGAADSFQATDANAASAREYGAQIFTYHQVVRLLTADHLGSQRSGTGGQITGALIHDLIQDEEIEIGADLVVNAAGAWAGQIASTAGVQVHMLPGKGTMLATNHRIVNTVINRCRMCADADIIVPAHTVAVIGTTDIPVKDPDRLAIEPWEVQLMLEEGDKLVPGFKEMRMLRAWAGVRPLYRESKGPGQGDLSANREMPRSFVLLDHETRDGVSGLVTITSGKWTTYRKMAEAAADLVCSKLGVRRSCRTHLEPLPVSRSHRSNKHEYHYLGTPLASLEKEVPKGLSPAGTKHDPVSRYTDLVCECELATLEDVENAILHGEARTIDDVRRDVRLGMGPCQGGFCTLRVAGMLHRLRQVDVETTNVALRDFLQERWKGLIPILWGQQLRQERLDGLIYLSVLNASQLVGPKASRLAPKMYEPPTADRRPLTAETPSTSLPLSSHSNSEAISPSEYSGWRSSLGGREPDLLVIGAGLAGLVSAWRAGEHGRKVHVIAKGWGALYWNAGCIDILGYSPVDPETEVDSPVQALEELIREHPEHPYALAGMENIERSIQSFQELCTDAGYPLDGSLERNWKLPTALGTARRTCLAPKTMIAGDLTRPDPVLVVGFKPILDFFPEMIAANLVKAGIPARGLLLDLPSLRNQRSVTTQRISWMLEEEEFRTEVVCALRPHLREEKRIGFPAVLGQEPGLDILDTLESQLGLPVFEIPGLPPSLPGIRLHKLLVKAIQKKGGRIFDGMQVAGGEAEERRMRLVWSVAASRFQPHTAQNFILATGGILGGGLVGTWQGEIRETALHLPVGTPLQRGDWFASDFLSPSGHPIYRSGIAVSGDFQPVDESGQILYHNLWAIGGNLAGSDPIQERSLEGIALATGNLVGEKIGRLS